jgi:hypothetical protein
VKTSHGRKSHTEFNAERNAWLTLEEETKVVKYCLALAKRGFLLNHKQLKFHVDSLLQAQLGDKFLEGGVSKNWSTQFIQQHSANLGHYWRTSLDTARGHAVNPNMNTQWYKMLGYTLLEKKIKQDCIWAANESGFQLGQGLKEQVIGAAHQKIQYQQHDSNRENITVMVTICADGEEIPPTIIYKGQSFSTNWHQGNTINAL